MNDSVARTMLEELVKCERMTFDSTSIDDDILVALAIAFSSLAAPRDWNLKYRERTYLEISKDMFSLTNDWATAGSIKEIFESNIVLHEQIGQGGFGTVYKATWIHAQEPNELVAVKIVPFNADDESLETELSIMNKVKLGGFDNLVHVKALYFFEEQPTHSKQPSPGTQVGGKQFRVGIVMKWYEDGSLRSLLAKTQLPNPSRACLSWSDKLQLAIDVCNGLRILHGENLLHRDVKADNVLLKKDADTLRMRGYLCDFGISASRESVNVRKQKGFGTLIFCAPELFDKKGPPKFSPLSDIYAFGMFLYEVMTHRFPFEQFVTESPDGSQLSNSRQHWSIGDIHKPGCNVALASRIIRKANLCITESILRETPDGYVDLLKKCIAFNPLERPPSMDEILAALEAIRAPFLGSSSSPQASDRVEKDANIIVNFSEEQTAILSEALAHTGSANVTPFMRSFMSLSVVDVFERKHEPAGGGAAATAAPEGH